MQAGQSSARRAPCISRSSSAKSVGGGASGIRTWSTALLSPALRWGKSRANPNRPTWQQRKTWAAASFGLGTRSLRFGCAKPLAQNPAESRDFPGRLALLPKSLCVGRLGGGASRIRTLSTPWRMESESEPPNLATEKNAGYCAFEAPNPQSPVRIRLSPIAKTPRNRANFSG